MYACTKAMSSFYMINHDGIEDVVNMITKICDKCINGINEYISDNDSISIYYYIIESKRRSKGSIINRDIWLLRLSILYRNIDLSDSIDINFLSSLHGYIIEIKDRII